MVGWPGRENPANVTPAKEKDDLLTVTTTTGWISGPSRTSPFLFHIFRDNWLGKRKVVTVKMTSIQKWSPVGGETWLQHGFHHDSPPSSTRFPEEERILKVTKKSGNRGRCRKLSLSCSPIVLDHTVNRWPRKKNIQLLTVETRT